MGNDDDRNAQTPVDVLDEAQDAPGRGGVQGGGGLVAQEHLGVAGQGPGNGDALLLPAGELHRIGVGLVGQAHQLQKLHGPLLCLDGGHPRDLHGEADIAQAGALHEQVKLLEDHADAPPLLPQGLGREGGHVLPVDEHASLGGTFQQVDAPHQGGLARAAHADDAVDGPVADGDIHMVQRGKGPLLGGKDLRQSF